MKKKTNFRSQNISLSKGGDQSLLYEKQNEDERKYRIFCFDSIRNLFVLIFFSATTAYCSITQRQIQGADRALEGACPKILDETFCAGTGTLGDPYLLFYIEDFQKINKRKEYLKAYYRVARDIDGSPTGDSTSLWIDGDGFRPIGSGTLGPFTGGINGAGFTISSFTIRRADEGIGFAGLIGQCERCGVGHLGLQGVSIETGADVGALIGYSKKGSIIQCSAEGNITSSAFSNSSVGGLVGINEGEITDSFFRGQITGDATGSSIGGMVGTQQQGGSLVNSYASVMMIPNTDGLTDNIHGLIGEIPPGGAKAHNSYWDRSLHPHDLHDGQGIDATKVELQQCLSPACVTPSPSSKTIYETWGTSIWDFGSDTAYPELRY